MLQRLKIKSKLLLIFLCIGIVSISTTGWIGYQNAKISLVETYFNQLTSIRETKKMQIETYFHQIQNQIITYSENQMIIDAMNRFKNAFLNIKEGDKSFDAKSLEYTHSVKDYYNEYLARLNPNIKNRETVEQYWPEDKNEHYHHAVYLQYHYIANNINPYGFKDNLEMADDGSEYSQVHSRYHPIIRNYLKKFGYYDIFLIDSETGHIVYSVFKEVDFATNLQTGPYKYTNIANAFKDARDASDKEFVKLVDFESYAPSYAAPASFIASPIFDGDKKIGVLVFQMPIDEINKVMTGNYNWENEGLGKSGETYIVGADHKMRSDSRFIIEDFERYLELLEQLGTDMEVINKIKSYSTSVLFQGVYTEGVEEALKGNSDTMIIDDYRGIPALSSYTPLNIESMQWVMLSEINKEEVFSSLHILRNKILATMVIISLFVLFFGFMISLTLSKPILKLTEAANKVQKGDFSVNVNITNKDEIGVLAASFNQMVEYLRNYRDELVASKDYVENIIKSMINSLVVTTPAAVIKEVNQATCDLTGYRKEELTGQPVKMLFAEDEPLKNSDIIDLIKMGSVICIEKSFQSKEGRKIQILLSCSVMHDANGELSGVVYLAQDITEHKRAEELEEKHDKLAKLTQMLSNTNRELNEFSYSVSHDLRAPLRSINGFSKALMEDYPDKLGEKGKNYLQRVCNASERMGHIINDLLNLSRITRADMSRERVDLSALAHDIVKNIQEMQPESKSEFVIAEGLVTDGDKRLLRIALVNLLNNALKYTSKRSEARIELGSTENDGKLSYFIRDNGAGFDMAYIDNLFVPFQRLHSTTEFEGTGIGLAIVKRIIHRHGGLIWAEGAVEKGATFYFTI